MALWKLASWLGRSVLPLMESTSVLVESVASLSNKAHTSVPTPKVQEPEKEAKRQWQRLVGPHSPPPLTLLFGWAGSTDKNLVKYSKIYLDQGCTTAYMILPYNLIFRQTEEVPEVMSEVVNQLEKAGIRERPLLVHCLSDTGVLCYQGLHVATQGKLNVCGVVWDSCPGPKPSNDIPRLPVILMMMMVIMVIINLRQ